MVVVVFRGGRPDAEVSPCLTLQILGSENSGRSDLGSTITFENLLQLLIIIALCSCTTGIGSCHSFNRLFIVVDAIVLCPHRCGEGTEKG